MTHDPSGAVVSQPLPVSQRRRRPLPSPAQLAAREKFGKAWGTRQGLIATKAMGRT